MKEVPHTCHWGLGEEVCDEFGHSGGSVHICRAWPERKKKKKLGVNLALKIESFNSAPVAFVNCSRLSFQSINFCSCIVEEMVGATTVF